MNDEIREILDYFRKYATIRENTMFSEIEDYITNLQKENERLKETNVYCNRTDCSGRLKDSRKYDSVYQEKEDYKSRVKKAIEDIEFCFRSIKQEADMSKDERTRHEMRTCLAIFNETLKSLKNGSDNNG